MDFLSRFPGTPRQIQADLLNALGQLWYGRSAFAISAPVATGKSRIAVAIARAVPESVAILTPTNILVRQYADEFDDLTTLYAQNTYASRFEFQRRREAAARAKAIACNYYTYVANSRAGMRKDIVIVDEAHKALDMLVERHSHTLWHRDWQFPDHITTLEELFEWADNVQDEQLQGYMQMLRSGDFIADMRVGMLRGKGELKIDIKPVSVARQSAWLWTRRTKKVVLMSATLSDWELAELGLDKRKLAVLEGTSPIPPANRLVVVDPVANMSYAGRNANIDALVERLRHELDTRQGRGLIHATYDVAARIQAKLQHPRLITHTPATTWSAYSRFLASKDKVLLASGLSEGIDLKYDKARWQIITTVPYPSLADPVVMAQRERNPRLYQWLAVKVLLQTFGRVCRSPDDYGITIILDEQFVRLYQSAKDMFPEYVQHSVTFR